MNRILFVFVLALLFSACNEKDKEKDPEPRISEEPYSVEQEVTEQIESARLDEVAPMFNGYRIEFPGLIINIDSLNIWDAQNTLKVLHQDHSEEYLELGEGVENRRIQILKSDYDKIAVFQRYETSFTIMDEGPHCDLMDWKHGYTKWKKLNIEDHMFRTANRKFSGTDGDIDVSVEELQQAVYAHCDEYWADHIADIESTTEYPAGIGVSRIIFKFILQNDQGKQIKTISFVNPMGC